MPLNTRAKRLLVAAGAVLALVVVLAAVPYFRLMRRIDAQLEAGPYARTFNYYASPEILAAKDEINQAELISALRRAGFKDTPSPGGNYFQAWPDRVTVNPIGGEPIQIAFNQDGVSRITSPDGRQNFLSWPIPPQLITNLSDSGRERRTLERFADLPPVLVHAVVSAEDKRFFQHSGFDPLRIAKAVYVDLKEKRKEQGASTITMQLARNLYLDRDKNWRRKLQELLITLHLERKLSKERIFEYYCNQVYLGGRGTFSINGFGEAAAAYFNKEVKRLTLPEAAMLAGLIQRPSYFNPFRYPNRARDRRNIVLQMMHQNGHIDAAEYASALNSPLGLNPGRNELSEAHYFLDIASEEMQKRIEEEDDDFSANVYTTLDLRLQKAAEQAITDGMKLVDQEVRKRRRKKDTSPYPQATLIALDPHTGEIRALVGGRDYTSSQLNHAIAKRPPGSSFKPFVYATALSSALEADRPNGRVITPATTVEDAPTTFRYENQTYSPSNFKHEFHGTVTLRRALAKSMNVAAVKVAEMTGYDRVVSLAHQAGMNEEIKPTPAVALGAYDVTPLEVAGAYTIFSNNGLYVRPGFLRAIRKVNGPVVYQRQPNTHRVLDPRVAFMMVSMLEEVLKSGTAAGVRARGFDVPAAGKTGTSHDGWFAGFTSELLCIVWVGYDDYRELNLEGAHSALPIWAEFMEEALRYGQYRDAKEFKAPEGVIKVTVDATTGMLAGPGCPYVVTDYYIKGTEPKTVCDRHEVNPDEFHLLDQLLAGEDAKPERHDVFTPKSLLRGIGHIFR